MIKYLYAHTKLFPNEGKIWPEPGELPASIDVESLTLECINVKPVGCTNFMGADTWNFQVVGHGDRWYHTHYDWSIVEDTPENIALLIEFDELHQQREALQLQASKLHNKIRHLRHGDRTQ
jgi:hypothetical protein